MHGAWNFIANRRKKDKTLVKGFVKQLFFPEESHQFHSAAQIPAVRKHNEFHHAVRSVIAADGAFSAPSGELVGPSSSRTRTMTPGLQGDGDDRRAGHEIKSSFGKAVPH